MSEPVDKRSPCAESAATCVMCGRTYATVEEAWTCENADIVAAWENGTPVEAEPPIDGSPSDG